MGGEGGKGGMSFGPRLQSKKYLSELNAFPVLIHIQNRMDPKNAHDGEIKFQPLPKDHHTIIFSTQQKSLTLVNSMMP